MVFFFVIKGSFLIPLSFKWQENVGVLSVTVTGIWWCFVWNRRIFRGPSVIQGDRNMLVFFFVIKGSFMIPRGSFYNDCYELRVLTTFKTDPSFIFWPTFYDFFLMNSSCKGSFKDWSLCHQVTGMMVIFFHPKDCSKTDPSVIRDRHDDILFFQTRIVQRLIPLSWIDRNDSVIVWPKGLWNIPLSSMDRPEGVFFTHRIVEWQIPLSQIDRHLRWILIINKNHKSTKSKPEIVVFLIHHNQ